MENRLSLEVSDLPMASTAHFNSFFTFDAFRNVSPFQLVLR